MDTLNKIKKQIPSFTVLKIGSFLSYLFYYLFQIGVLLSIQKVVDGYLSNQVIPFTLPQIVISGIACIIIFILLNFVFQLFFRTLEFKGRMALSPMLFKRLLAKDYNFFAKNDSGEQLVNVIDISTNVGTFLTLSKVQCFQSLFVMVICIILLMSYSVPLTIIILLLIFTLFLSTKKINEMIAKYNKKQLDIYGESSQVFLQTYSGISVIKQLGKESFFHNKFATLINKKRFTAFKQGVKYHSIYKTLFSLLTMFLPIIALVLGMYFVSNGILSVGGMIAYYTLIAYIVEPVFIISDYVSFKQQILEIAKLYVDLMRDDENKVVDQPILFENIELHLNEFHYEEGKHILNDFNLMATTQDFICIKGESGCGKSTLFKLLLKVENYTNGTITLNNACDFNKINKEQWYKNCLGVDQSYFVFEGSLIDNITLGDTYSNADIQEIIDICLLNDFVKEYGLERIINESGSNLSGGQKQRIALARILIRKPKLLLLDEVTSSLDIASTNLIVKNIQEFTKKYNIGVICISHKNEFDGVATKIIEL